jgi:chromosome segregation ATPase
LGDIRRRWAEHRREEVAKVQSTMATCDKLRLEYAELRQSWQARWAALDDEQRILAEKTMALEQFREETAALAGDTPTLQRRVERLRRRWITQNANAIRAVARERQALKTEMASLETRFEEFQKRAAEVAAAEMAVSDKQMALEQKKTLLAAQHATLKQELKTAQAQRDAAQNLFDKTRDDIERIARSLIDEPEPPSLPADKAA